MMKAIVVHKTKNQPRLNWESVPDISFNDEQVLVDVKASAVNRADLLQARGLYPPPAGESTILGLEMCGRISAMGHKVSGWKIGDRVMALLPGGGYAEKAINYNTQDFAAEIRSGPAAGSVSLILDPIGGSYLTRNLAVLAENGRLVNIGLLGGRTAEIDLAVVLGKSLHIIGSRLRHRSLTEKIRITAAFRKRFWSHFIASRMEPVIDSVFSIRDAGSAHDHVRRDKNIGKVILKLD